MPLIRVSVDKKEGNVGGKAAGVWRGITLVGPSDPQSCGTLLSKERSLRRLEGIFLWSGFRLRLATTFMGDFKCSFAQSQGDRGSDLDGYCLREISWLSSRGVEEFGKASY